MQKHRQPEAVVVNDDPIQLLMLSEILKKENLRVTAFENTRAALDHMHVNGAPDLIITDLNMPGIDGWRFCSLLRSPEYEHLNRTPILITSATFSGAETRDLSLEVGANAFLGVPFRRDVLLGHVRTLLAGESPAHTPVMLIVEDSATQATIIKETAEQHGYIVHLASTAAEGRSLFQKHHPEVVVLDHYLPGDNGETLITEFKHPDSRAVVIMITTDPTPELAAQWISMGADAYIRKPFDNTYLFNTITRAKRSRALLGVTDLLETRTLQLRESEERMRNGLEGSNVGIWDWNIVTGEIIAVRPWGEMLGYLPGEIENTITAWKEYIHPDDRSTIEKKLHDLITGHSPFHETEYRFRAKSGHWQWFLMRCKIISRSPTGKPLRAIGMYLEITERKELEDQFRQAQRMEAIGQLAGGIAHDFNNLLTGILGYANILKLETPPNTSVHDTAKTIEKAAERAAELTAQLLGFARKGKLRNLPVNLHETIPEVVRLLSRTIDKNIHLRQNLSANHPITIGEPGQIHQAILNLAMNARDAMPNGGSITIETDIIHINEAYLKTHPHATVGPHIIIAITDTGCGISKEIQKKIFDPFFTTKEQGQSVGMGLPMVYGIVRNHNGWIEVHSEEGQGATFRLYLPLAPDTTAHIVTAPDDPAPIHGSGAILLVDDEEVIRNIGVILLDRLGYTPIAAASAAEAIEIYKRRSNDIRLVIIDMVMPEMDGRQCFEALLSINPELRAILSSGYDRNGRAQEILDKGMLGFVQKPYCLQALATAVAAALPK